MIELEDIKDPSFVKSLSIKELKELANQIRAFLIENVSKTGGHLSSNLGVVELTIAMYYVFDPEKDKFLFDVGHQSYVHKILTGRAKDFKGLRRFNGMSGYINREESKYDIWESGHSSTTISAMSGMLCSSDEGRVVSFIGDSSIMNGVAFEGLNYLGQMKKKSPIIILNDNKMGISKTVGSLTKTFEKFRRTKLVRVTKTLFNKVLPTFVTRNFHQLKRGIKGMIQQDNIFEDLGFDYYGPYDGNDIKYCINALKKVKDSNEPIIVHFITKKGKGYTLSEEDSIGDFHGVSPFDINTGKSLCQKGKDVHSYSEIVARYLNERYNRKKLFVITPAMKVGTGIAEFSTTNVDFIDVGIAEEHAADMAAGIALSKKDVVVLMYSTFSQRAYDQILNDIARQDLKVVFGIDRAGIVGEDGQTHAGVYDISMFMSMPNIGISMGINGMETIGLLNYALDKFEHPMVVRYPRGNDLLNLDNIDYEYTVDFGWTIVNDGSEKILISYGPDVLRLKKIINDNKLNVKVVNARFIKPMDYKMLDRLFKENKPIYIFEQAVNNGTLYHKILEYKEKNNYSSKIYALGLDINSKIKYGKISEVLDDLGFSDEDFINWLK